MRNIADIIEDDKNGKQLSQTERQIAVAYIQGKYDAVLELKIGNNSNTNEVLDKIRAEIEELDGRYVIGDYGIYGENSPKYVGVGEVLAILEKYKSAVENHITAIPYTIINFARIAAQRWKR